MEARKSIERKSQMPLTFTYDEAGDILYIDAVAPYAEQESDEIAENVVARFNPKTGAVENLEILFFTRGLFHSSRPDLSRLSELFAVSPAVSNPASTGKLHPR
jgi:hypothetical protein